MVKKIIIKLLRMPVSAITVSLLLVISCATVEFDNPLDPKGENYLWGYDVPREVEQEMISKECEDCSAQLWTSAELSCDRRSPGISIKGNNPARLRFGNANDIERYKAMMGLSENYWFDAIDIDRGGRNTQVTVEIVLSESRDAHDRHDYMGEMPLPGRYFIIYIVRKPDCLSGYESSVPVENRAERVLIVE